MPQLNRGGLLCIPSNGLDDGMRLLYIAVMSYPNLVYLVGCTGTPKATSRNALSKAVRLIPNLKGFPMLIIVLAPSI
jgi:hypothetical protein